MGNSATTSSTSVDWVALNKKRLQSITDTLETYVLLMRRPSSRLTIKISSVDVEFLRWCYDSRVASIHGMMQNYRIAPDGAMFFLHYRIEESSYGTN